MLYEVYGIDSLVLVTTKQSKSVSFVEVTNIRTNFRKTNKLISCEIGKGVGNLHLEMRN